MGLFAYQAINARGKKIAGEIEADSERAARKLLKLQQLVPRQLQQVEHKQSEGAASCGRGHLNAVETTTFLQQLATLFGAGMTLTDALDSIADGMENRRARRVVAAIRQQVLEGGSLAAGLKNQGFNEVVYNMVAAGEETGQLESVALRLADLLEHRDRMRQDLLSATLYPAIIMGFGLLVMVFLLTVVVPQVVTVFERAGSNLPWLTEVMISISAFLRDDGIYVLLVLVGLGIAYRVLLRNPKFKYRRDRLLLRVPGVRTLLSKTEAARFSHTLGMLLSGGVPTLSAMYIATQSLGLLPVREIAEQARETLREGGNLSEALKIGGYFPHLATRLIAVGEQSGTLDRMLLKVAQTFEQEIARNLKRMLTVLEPVLVLLMALVVGALALAILLPIIEMNELIR